MKKIFTNLFKIISLVVLVPALWMPGYFAVRSFFPMDRPEFGGLSFWELVKWRSERFDELAHTYEVSTGKEPKYGMCIRVEVGLIITMAAPESMICGVMNTRDEWRKVFDNRADMRMIGCGTIEASWLTAPKVAWEIFENYLSVVLSAQSSAVKYCRQGLSIAGP